MRIYRGSDREAPVGQRSTGPRATLGAALTGDEDEEAGEDEEGGGEFSGEWAVGEGFFEEDEEGDGGDPEEVHDAAEEEEHHEKPAAAEAERAVVQAHAECISDKCVADGYLKDAGDCHELLEVVEVQVVAGVYAQA